MKRQQPKPRKVKLVKSSYQPSKVELQEEVKLDCSFDELFQAMFQPVDVEWIERPEKRD